MGKPRWPTLLTLLVAFLACWGATAGLWAAPYRRADWLRGWATGQDAAHPCRDTRQLVLARDAQRGSPEPGNQTLPLTWSEDGCRVVGGTWIDPYTGALVTDPTALDIDHVIPLGYVARHGGQAWPQARQRAYAVNLGYRGHLLAVGASANRAKGDQGPAAWVPPNPAYACRYAESWAVVAVVEGVRLPPSDREALRRLAASC